MNSQTFWAVSLSIPIGDDLDAQQFRELAIIKVDANTGKVAEVKIQR